MTQHLITHTVFLFFMLLSFVGAAKADIVQCIGNSGATTFSDAPCAFDADTMLVPLTKKASFDEPKLARQTGRFVAAEKARALTSANRLLTKRGLPLDDTTLQSARSLTASMDSTSKSARQLTMATLAVYP